jgi:hypothetical protein
MPEIAKFPGGFDGSAIIVWEIPHYPALPVQNGQVIEDFPPDGVLITSSRPQYGAATDEYYFVQPDGRLVPAKDVSVSVGEFKQGSKSMHYTNFFVGTKDPLALQNQRALIKSLFDRLVE